MNLQVRRRDAALAALAIVLGCSKSAPRPARDPWLTNEKDALDLARREKRPLLIFFFAEWNEAGVRLRKETFASERFLKAAERFVLLRLDHTDDESAAAKEQSARYKVLGLPHVILLGSNGDEVARIVELLPAEEFARRLETIP